MNISSNKIGFHPTVLLDETIKLLVPQPGQIYLDATLGHGGHTLEILKSGATVYGLDADKISLDVATKRIHRQHLSANFHPFHDNFTNYQKIANSLPFRFTGVIFDLGLNLAQYLQPSGFSFTHDSPLDMRLDPMSQNTQASDILNKASMAQLYSIFSQYSQEPYSQEIADSIIAQRKNKRFQTTFELADLIQTIYHKHHRLTPIHPATKVFMALRMAVNHELENLNTALNDSLSPIFSNTIFCFISFHSGEDRLIKKFVSQHRSQITLLTPKPIRPTPFETSQNPSSRSALLRSYRIN